MADEAPSDPVELTVLRQQVTADAQAWSKFDHLLHNIYKEAEARQAAIARMGPGLEAAAATLAEAARAKGAAEARRDFDGRGAAGEGGAPEDECALEDARATEEAAFGGVTRDELQGGARARRDHALLLHRAGADPCTLCCSLHLYCCLCCCLVPRRAYWSMPKRRSLGSQTCCIRTTRLRASAESITSSRHHR